MKIFALCPSFRRLKSLRFSVWQFLQQDISIPAYFIFYDESGDITEIDDSIKDRVFGINHPHEYITVPEKYKRLVKFIDDVFRKDPEDVLVIWDDDDIYLPNHLANHVQALSNAPWSKPSKILSYYNEKLFVDENTWGRFHGSIAMRRECVDRVCWNSEKDSWDLVQIDELTKAFGQPADSYMIDQKPSYCYFWSKRPWHYSWFCGKQGNVWELIKSSKIKSEGIGPLYPYKNELPATKEIYDKILANYFYSKDQD